jgi:pyridoxamine 5'-phosphate oxidase-like protein
MVTWSEFAAAAPEIAAAGRRLLVRDGIDQALLATVSGDEPPRIHPIYTAVVDGRLYAFILGSAKLRHLDRDGRFALHAHVDPAAPSEFLVRGRATRVRDEAIRAAVAAGWWFEVDDTYALFEFSIESALLGVRDTTDDWPPRYRRWSSPGAGS